MSDTSLVFNLVARDQTGETLTQVRERFDAAAAGIGVGVAAALGVGVAASLDMEAANAKMAAQLGIGPEKAAELAKVSASVYGNAWGDSVQTVNDAIRGVYQNIGDTSKAEGGMEGLTTKALALAETFDQEVGPTTAAVGQLLKTGLAKNADEAFDIITAGMQKGANRQDDFLDTLIGGADNLKTFGFTGQQATGLIVQGMNAGAESADSVVGLFEELVGNVAAGGDDLAQTFKDLGLNSRQMAVDLTSGGPAANAALDKLLDSIRSLKDPIKQDAMMAALFGEEGAAMQNTLMAIDPSSAVQALGEIEGSTEKVAKTMGESPAAALETFKRQAMQKLGAVSGTFIQFATDNQAVFVPLAYTLAGLAATVLTVKASMMTYSAISAVVAGANTIISASAWGVIGNWLRMMGIGLMAYVRIAAGAVASALTTAAAWTGSALVSIGTWILAVIRAAVVSGAQFLLMAARAVAWAAVMAAQWLIAMGPVGWVIAAVIGLVALIIANWDTVKRWTLAVWDWVWKKVQSAVGAILSAVSFLGRLPGMVAGYFGRMKDWAVRKALELVSWVSGLPGRIGRAVGSLGSLLTSKGRDVILGLWNGISGMGGWLWSKITSFVKNNVVDAAKSFLHIGSPSKLMADAIGQWIPAGIAVGAEDNRGVLDKTMAGLVDPQAAIPGRPLSTGMAPLMGAQAGGGAVIVRFEMAGASDEFHNLMRKITRVKGRGNVQTAFGQ